MPLSSLVAIVLRLYAIHWAVGRLGFLVQAVSHDETWSRRPLALVVTPILTLFLAGVVFFLAGKIARLVTRGLEVEVSLGGLSAYDMCCFAFTGLGLYFALSSVGSVVEWGRMVYFIQQGNPQWDPSMRNTLSYVPSLVKFGAGFLCLFYAPQLARAVERIQRRGQPV